VDWARVQAGDGRNPSNSCFVMAPLLLITYLEFDLNLDQSVNRTETEKRMDRVLMQQAAVRRDPRTPAISPTPVLTAVNNCLEEQGLVKFDPRNNVEDAGDFLEKLLAGEPGEPHFHPPLLHLSPGFLVKFTEVGTCSGVPGARHSVQDMRQVRMRMIIQYETDIVQIGNHHKLWLFVALPSTRTAVSLPPLVTQLQITATTTSIMCHICETENIPARVEFGPGEPHS
jgi:hypothetical protein